jgi:hypothetical protein
MRPRRLQITSGAGDADAAHAQHVGQKFVGQVEAVGMRPILGHQQPASEPRTDAVKTCASGRRRKLCHQHIQVAVQGLLESLAASEFTTKRRRCDTPRRSRALHQRMQGDGVHSEDELRAQNAAIARSTFTSGI